MSRSRIGPVTVADHARACIAEHADAGPVAAWRAIVDEDQFEVVVHMRPGGEREPKVHFREAAFLAAAGCLWRRAKRRVRGAHSISSFWIL